MTQSDLSGTYRDDQLDATLTISGADVSKGSIAGGSIVYGGHTYEWLTGKFGFENNTGSSTVVAVVAINNIVGSIAFTLGTTQPLYTTLVGVGSEAKFNGVTFQHNANFRKTS